MAYQYDEGHTLEVKVPTSVTTAEIQYWIRGMDKAEAYTPGEITAEEDGTYTITGNIPNSFFEHSGDLRVYVVVTDDSASVVTYEGYVHIVDRQMPEDYVDDDPENEATRVLIEAQEAAATATAAAETCEEVAESIPEDYSALSQDVTDLKADLKYSGAYNYLSEFTPTVVNTGVTYTPVDGEGIAVAGTPSESLAVYYNWCSSINAFPAAMTPGRKYYVEYSATNVDINFWIYKNGSYYTGQTSKESFTITIPNDATGLVIRLRVQPGITANETVYPRVTSIPTNTMLESADQNLQNEIDDINNDINDINNEIEEIRDENYKYNFYDAFALGNGTTGNKNGVDYTKNADGTWTIDGTASGVSFLNVIESITSVPKYIVPGRKYRVSFNGGTVPLRLYVFENDSTSFSYYLTFTSDTVFVMPSMTGLILRFNVAQGETVDNETVHYTLIPETVTSIDNHYTYNTTVEQTVQQYSNTYNLNVSPTITTDTNGWLAAVDTETSNETGKTDMTAAIMAMLNNTGYCHLGEGIFYVSGNIDMPVGSMIEGCGRKTIIRLLSSVSSGYAIKMQNRNTICNIRISGAYSTIARDTQGTRNGILFAANYDGQEGETAFDTECCMIDNVWIDNFNDSGIKCHNSSISVHRGIYATNIYIQTCWAGINIDYRSEFHKFTNVCVYACKYGCINNGGNNVFTACTFHASLIGFYIDGTQPNSAHGTLNGCTFCHIGSNAGSAITMENITHGYVVSNCQIWYCSIDITNCSGISFVGCEFGRGTTNNRGAKINISGGNLVMFDGCMFMDDVNYPPEITITNNTKVKFDACYGSASGNAITAA